MPSSAFNIENFTIVIALDLAKLSKTKQKVV